MVSRFLGTFLVVLQVAGVSLAASRDDIHVADLFPTGGPCRAVAFEGTTLHFATGGYLCSANVADPAAPELLGLTWFGVLVQDVVLVPGDESSLACVCLGTHGLRLVDVTNPAAPQVRGGLSGVEVRSAVWMAPRLYTVSGSDGVLVVDPADPDAPVVTGQIPARPGHLPRALAVRPGFLFASYFDQTLQEFSLAQPDSPFLFASMPGAYGALACWGEHVLALTTAGMHVIDASDYSHLTVIGTWGPDDPAGRPHDLATQDDRVWIADRILGLHLVDLSIPAVPTSLDLLPERAGQAWSIGCAGTVTALGLTDEGVRFYAAEGGEINILGTCTDPHPAPIEFLGTSGNLVVGADESRVLTVYSSEALGGPIGQLGFDHQHFAGIDGFDADGGIAFLAAKLNHYPHTCMYVFNVSDPANPVEVYAGSGLPASPQGTGEVAMDGHLAFVDCNGIYAYDLSDPTDPQNAGLYGFGHGTFGVELLQQKALCTWVQSEESLVVVDRTDTWNMEVLEILPVPAVPTAMAAFGDRFYAATFPGLWVFDVSTPGESLFLGTVPIDGYVHDLAVSVDGVWVALGGGGLQLWDLADPQAPSLRASLTDQGRIDGVTTVGDLAVAEASHRGMLWLMLNVTPVPGVPQNLVLQQNAPNPFNPRTEIAFTLDRAGPVRLEVFDLSGHQLRVLLDRVLPAGPHRISWDGRNAAGRPVASGTYLYRLVGEEWQMVRRMTLLK